MKVYGRLSAISTIDTGDVPLAKTRQEYAKPEASGGVAAGMRCAGDAPGPGPAEAGASAPQQVTITPLSRDARRETAANALVVRPATPGLLAGCRLSDAETAEARRPTREGVMSLILPRAYREDPSRFDGRSLGRRDPAYLRDYLPLLEFLHRYYFRVVERGFDRAPADEPFLIVGSHNGGINAPDTAMTMLAWYVQRGTEAPVYALIQPDLFAVPYLNVHMMKLGGIAATARMAIAALQSGAPVLVYPGAGDDAYKPYKDRHRVSFFGNDAFVRLALRFQVPVVPVVSVGAHETLIVLDDGRERARELGLAQQGVERLPLTLSFPYGLALGMPFNIPFPVKMQLEMGAPIRFAHTSPASDRDPAVVKRCYDAVVQVMQSMVDRLVRERAGGDRAGAA